MARRVSILSHRSLVRVTPYHPAERYILFEFEVESVLVTEYKGDETMRTRWKVDE